MTRGITIQVQHAVMMATACPILTPLDPAAVIR